MQLQAIILVGFAREEVDIFKHMMNDMDGDMVKVRQLLCQQQACLFCSVHQRQHYPQASHSLCTAVTNQHYALLCTHQHKSIISELLACKQ